MPPKPLMRKRTLPITNYENQIPKLAVKRLCECLKLIDDNIINETNQDCSEYDDTKSVISGTSRSKSASSFYNYQNMVCRQKNQGVKRKISRPLEMQEPMIIRKQPCQNLNLAEVSTFESQHKIPDFKKISSFYSRVSKTFIDTDCSSVDKVMSRKA